MCLKLPTNEVVDCADIKRWIEYEEKFENKTAVLYSALKENWVVPKTIKIEKRDPYSYKMFKREVPAPWLEDRDKNQEKVA